MGRQLGTAPFRALAGTFCGLIALLVAFHLAAPTSAQAAVTHEYKSSIPISFPVQIAVDQVTGQVYVFEIFGDNEYSEPSVRRFDADGNPSIFSALGTNQVDGCCLGTQDADQAPANGIGFGFGQGGPNQITVDSSPGATQHDLIVPFLDIVFFFSSNGTYLYTLGTTTSGGCGAATDPDGSLYIGHEGPTGVPKTPDFSSHVDKYSPGAHTTPQKYLTSTHLYPREEGVCNVGADSAGGVYVNRSTLLKTFGANEETTLEYYAPNLFDLTLEDRTEGYVGVLGKPIADKTSTFAVDPANDDLFATENGKVAHYDSEGNLLETFGEGEFTHGAGIAVNGTTGRVYVSDLFGGVRIYDPIVTPDITEVSAIPGQTAAAIKAHVAPAGSPTVTECEIQYGATEEYGSAVPCGGAPYGAATNVSVDIPGLETETTYHYRIKAVNANGVHRGIDHTFTTHAVAGVVTGQPTDVTLTSATLNGSFTGNGESTTTFFEWGKTKAYGTSTPEVTSSPSGAAPAAAGLTGLLSYTANSGTYHYRLVAKNGVGTSYGDDVELHTVTPDLPTIYSTAALALSDTSATLTAQVNPQGGPTGVRFEFGQTLAFGSVREIPDPLPPDTDAQHVSVTLTGLTPGTTYHYHAVASNFAGSVIGEDAAFNTPAAPQAVGLGTSNVGTTGATVKANIRPGFMVTAYHFEYGRDLNYGASAGAGSLGGEDNLEHEVAGSLTGLAPGTTYHLRVVAANALGTVAGGDQTFTTGSVPGGGGTKPGCKKGFVKRHGKCVKKKRHKRHTHGKRGAQHRG